MSKKIFYKRYYFRVIPIFLFGFVLGVILIWPGIISGNSRKCFFEILKDGSDGDIKLKTILSVQPNYLLKIRNAKNKYIKVLLVGDSCFRKLWNCSFWLKSFRKKYLVIFFKGENIIKYSLLIWIMGVIRFQSELVTLTQKKVISNKIVVLNFNPNLFNFD